LVVKYAEDQHKKREMTRLQNLTTHNVYRYLNTPTMQPHELATDPYKASLRTGEKLSHHSQPPSPYYYQPSPVQQQHAALAQMSPHQAPRSPVQPPSVSPQGYHGLGGINTVFNGAGPAQPLHHLQMPAVSLQMHQPGSGLASPVMGAVSPNHFLYQQQQMLQQQLTGVMQSPPTPMMSPSYSPRSVRRSNPGRNGSNGRDNAYFNIDVQPSPSYGAMQGQQLPPAPAYGSWYSTTPSPPQGHRAQHQPPMAYIGANGNTSPLAQNVYGNTGPQQQARQMTMHPGMEINVGGVLPLPPQRSPALRQSPLGGFPQQSMPSPQQHQHLHQHAQHHAAAHSMQQSPHMMPPSPGQQTFYTQHPGGAPMLQPSPYLSNSYAVEGPRGGGQAPMQYMAGAGTGSVALSIANLPANADVALLHELFAPYGRVLNAQIDVDGTAGGLCSGRGRVQMATPGQADAACGALNGSNCFGEVPLQVRDSF
jgi:hypothetical protein